MFKKNGYIESIDIDNKVFKAITKNYNLSSSQHQKHKPQSSKKRSQNNYKSTFH